MTTSAPAGIAQGARSRAMEAGLTANRIGAERLSVTVNSGPIPENVIVKAAPSDCQLGYLTWMLLTGEPVAGERLGEAEVAEQRVKCGGTMHRIVWGAGGANFAAHETPPDPSTGCARRVSEWAAVMPLAEVAGWVDAGFRRPALAGEWRSGGLAPAQAKQWSDTGFNAYEGVAWASAGVAPHEVPALSDRELTFYDAETLGAVGCTVRSAVELADSYGLELESAVALIAACEGDLTKAHSNAKFVPFIVESSYSGFLEASDYRDALAWIVPSGLQPEGLDLISRRGFPREVEGMVRAGMSLDEMRAWTAAFPRNGLIVAAYRSGRTLDDAVALFDAVQALGHEFSSYGVPYDSRLTPEDVAAYRNAGFAPGPGPKALSSGMTVAQLREVIDDPVIAPWADQFLVSGISEPEEIRRWIAAQISAGAARKFAAAGIGSEAALAWAEHGYGADAAIEFATAGQTPESLGHIFAGEKWSTTFSRVRGETHVYSVKKLRSGVVHALFTEYLAPRDGRSSLFGSAYATVSMLDGGYEWSVPYGFGGGSPMHRVHGNETFKWICGRLGLGVPRGV